MKKITLVLIAVFTVFFSCSSEDNVKSSENYIEEFTINGIKPIQIILKQDQNLINILTSQENKDNLSNADPSIKFSKNATHFKSGEDWTAKGFFYTVVAENGEERKYSIQISIAYNKYSFETWDLSNLSYGYWIPSDSNSAWSSGNAGISMALGMFPGKDSRDPESYPTRKTDKGYNGSNAVIMETIEGGRVQLMNKDIPIISGNFFLGNFNVAKLINDELAATEVGSIYFAKPKSVKYWYKYKEGDGVFNNKGTPIPNRQDSCNVHISFYQGDSPTSGKDTILTVKDIDDSELVIADATMENCSATEGDDFHEFALVFTYKREPDFENHYYKIAITFAASRHGDSYAGKIGSTLIVDEVEIENY